MGKELTQIMQHIHNGHHFLLSGGAGSGKTHTLVEVIKHIISEYPASLIACITYTNAAVQEIDNRVNHNNLRVSTIHDFLWDCISNFQEELRDSLVKLINDGIISVGSNAILPIDAGFFVKNGEFVPIKYKEYLRINEGVISHDEVLKVANYMFTNYPKLRDIIKSTYPFILIDEYQDTSPLVVNIFLESFDDDNDRFYCIGFFGDSMQAIYDDGVGDIDAYKYPTRTVYEVKKEQNRRSPQVVIDLANKIRLDSLVQHPSDDKQAPNMDGNNVKTGKVLFLYSQTETTTIEEVRAYLSDNEGWFFDNPQKVKELNLTHRLIAKKAGFATLMEIHSGDSILKYRNKIHKFIKTQNIDTAGKSFGEVLLFLERTFTDAQTKR